MSSNCIEEAFI